MSRWPCSEGSREKIVEAVTPLGYHTPNSCNFYLQLSTEDMGKWPSGRGGAAGGRERCEAASGARLVRHGVGLAVEGLASAFDATAAP
jgi:hypothetical protein